MLEAPHRLRAGPGQALWVHLGEPENQRPSSLPLQPPPPPPPQAQGPVGPRALVSVDKSQHLFHWEALWAQEAPMVPLPQFSAPPPPPSGPWGAEGAASGRLGRLGACVQGAAGGRSSVYFAATQVWVPLGAGGVGQSQEPKLLTCGWETGRRPLQPWLPHGSPAGLPGRTLWGHRPARSLSFPVRTMAHCHGDAGGVNGARGVGGPRVALNKLATDLDQTAVP